MQEKKQFCDFSFDERHLPLCHIPLLDGIKFVTLNKLSGMETLLIKVSERKKANMLIELLRSMDFIESVDYIGNFKSARELFTEVNEIASASDLKDMTMDEINHEINEYRLKKKSGSN